MLGNLIDFFLFVFGLLAASKTYDSKDTKKVNWIWKIENQDGIIFLTK